MEKGNGLFQLPRSLSFQIARKQKEEYNIQMELYKQKKIEVRT